MKTKTLVLTTIFFLLSVSARAIEEVKRTISKEFSVSADDEIIVINKYGNLTIAEWEKNKVSFIVEITGRGEKTQIAQKMADRVSVDFNKKNKNISAETIFQEIKFNCNNCGTTVNYTINVPTDVYLNLTNKYGNIVLSKTNRSFRCNLKYGNLTATRLSGESNSVDVKYGNVNINETPTLNLDIKYGNLTLEKVGTLKFTSGYSNNKIGSANKINLVSKYDSFKIRSLGKLNMTSDYSKFDIGELKESFIAPAIRYGKVKIEKIAAGFNEINIGASYTPIHLGITSRHNFQAKLYNRYGDIKTNGLTFHHVNFDDEKDRYAKNITATVGISSSPEAKITISNRYADIIFEK